MYRGVYSNDGSFLARFAFVLLPAPSLGPSSAARSDLWRPWRRIGSSSKCTPLVRRVADAVAVVLSVAPERSTQEEADKKAKDDALVK